VLAAMTDVHALEHRLHLRFALARGIFGVDERQLHVLVDGELVDQIEALEDEADVALRIAARLLSG